MINVNSFFEDTWIFVPIIFLGVIHMLINRLGGEGCQMIITEVVSTMVTI